MLLLRGLLRAAGLATAVAVAGTLLQGTALGFMAGAPGMLVTCIMSAMVVRSQELKRAAADAPHTGNGKQIWVTPGQAVTEVS